MYKKLATIASDSSRLTFLFCAGFEQRATRAPTLLEDLSIRAHKVALLKYDGEENTENLVKLRAAAINLCSPAKIEELAVSNLDIKNYFSTLDKNVDELVIDITGMSRIAMMKVLSSAHDANIRTKLIYTEAAEYYPTKRHYDDLIKNADPDEAFLKLNEFEKDEIIYSMYCDVEEISGLSGRMLPNYPLMLVAFLTFKRGRISAVLQAYEANVRILIKGVPVRSDLKWRADAMAVPNLDLLEDSVIKELETLDWHATYEYLSDLYDTANNKYRFNFVLAPLGSKMQTVGAWLFAKERNEIKVVTSTPKKLFYERYSVGFGDTFLVDDLPIGPFAPSP